MKIAHGIIRPAGRSVALSPPLNGGLQAPYPHDARIPSALFAHLRAGRLHNASDETKPPHIHAFSFSVNFLGSTFIRPSSSGKREYYIASKLRSCVWPRRPSLDQNFPDVLVHQLVAPDNGPSGDAVRAAVDVRYLPARLLNEQRSGSDVPRVLGKENGLPDEASVGGGLTQIVFNSWGVNEVH